MWFWGMNHVMNPATRLLNAYRSPFLFGHQMLRYNSDEFLGQHNMPITKETKQNIVNFLDEYLGETKIRLYFLINYGNLY